MRAFKTFSRATFVSVPSALRLAGRLRAGEWDTLVLLHHLTTAFGIAKYAALSLGSGAARRVGLDNGRGEFPPESKKLWLPIPPLIATMSDIR